MLQRIRSSFWTPAAAILQSRHCTRPGSLQQPPGDRRGVSGLPGSPAGRGGLTCAALTCSGLHSRALPGPQSEPSSPGASFLTFYRKCHPSSPVTSFEIRSRERRNQQRK